MQQIKVFSSRDAGGDLVVLTQLVNDWLEREQPRIIRMSQSSQGPDLVLTFLHERPHAQPRGAAVPEEIERGLDDADLDPTEPAALPDVELPY